MKFFKVLPFLALLTALCSFGQAEAAETIKIGNIIPLSGPSASVGIQGKNAREMAVEEINAAGGIKSLGGAKLQLVFSDSKSDPTTGVTEAERLINSEKVHVLTGAWNSAVTYPVTQTAERYGMPFIVPVSVRDTITERGFKNVFRIAAKDSWWTRDQFKFLDDMKKEFGVDVKNVAFVYENGDWGVGFAEKWREMAKERGYKVVLDEPYPSTASDLTPVVIKLKRSKADVVFMTSNAADAILLTNTMAEMKVNVKAIITSGGGHADPSFLKAAGKNAEYIFDLVEWEADLNRPGLKETNEKFTKKYGYSLAGESVDAYASMYLIKDVLERAGSTKPEAVRKALIETNLCGGTVGLLAYDCIQFDQSGQNKNASLVIVQIRQKGKDMERITVWPKNVRRAGYTPVFPQPNK
ncbi:ABC transporter substrate-binding protein [Geovibrio thiophilus]|uniref:ABC transporter substrate-binding protein n=1 Tax=Geovibrio thiophilus TaxID=139438 RepID=A0A410JZH1_9BACT|nr:ABC transporter substrate-binding protein [Geovibrio thiophilus]QAR33475.1 ABC transporter substrate-binding protein [Geovibrio thiophilus]